MITINLNHPETIEEYESIVSVYNQVWSDNLATAAEWRHSDKDWPEKYLSQRFVVKLGDEIIAEGAIMEPFWMHVPGKYSYGYSLLPAYDTLEFEGGTVHSAVYAFVLDYLGDRKPQALVAFTREDKVVQVQWLLGNGFRQTMRYPVSRLDMQSFDKSRFPGVQERVAASGIDMLTLPELQTQDSEWKWKVHALCTEIELDIPSLDPPTPQPLEEFEKIFNSPNFLAEGWVVAVDNAQERSGEVGPYVGITMLGVSQATPEKMHTWVTGVTRPYRLRGIALAMKLQSLDIARRRGARIIETDNEENNPMFQINLKLGFKPQPAWLDFEKTFEYLLDILGESATHCTDRRYSGLSQCMWSVRRTLPTFEVE